MAWAYFDCFSGIAGDMALAALVDAGCPIDTLRETIERLGLPGVSLRDEKVQRHGLAATRVHVELGPQTGHKHRHLPRILEIIDNAGLAPRAAQRARAVFERLAHAEAAVHGTSVDKVHFHEVGADDAIVDIVCTCVALDVLDVERVFASPVPTGSGTVRCDHGLMPVPAPATAQLLRGVPLADCDEPGELTTPTGAALVAELADRFGPLPAMRLDAVGVGTGAREGKTRPNILRVLVGQAGPSPGDDVDEVVVLETQIDDATGQLLGHSITCLLEAGALDAFIVPIMMKKGRPGHLLTVLSRHHDADAIEKVVFEQTRTFGVRRYAARRRVLARSHEVVQTRFGRVRVKVGRRGGAVATAWPEYEDCAKLARKHGVSLVDVQQEALARWQQPDESGTG